MKIVSNVMARVLL